MPLFHVLALNAKVVLSSPYDSLWSQLTGIALEENNLSLTTIEKEAPLFLKDVSSLLIQIFYALPLNVDKGLIDYSISLILLTFQSFYFLQWTAYFTTIVQTLFNLRLVQGLAQLSCLMTENQRIEAKEHSLKNTANYFSDLMSILGFIVDNLEHSQLYVNLDEEVHSFDIKLKTILIETYFHLNDQKIKVWSITELKETVINICLPFLRVAAMLSHHLYSEPFPQLSDNITEEFNTLVQFLYLGSKTDLVNNNSITHCLNWTCDTPLKLIETWCQEYINFVSKSLIGARVMPYFQI